MNRILILLLTAIIGFPYARADFDSPDFAYPATVIADADSVLRHATGLDRIRAVMQITRAKSLVAPDSLMAMPAFVGRVAATEKNPELRGLLILFQADVMKEYYNKVQYKVDGLDAPARPRPADISEWTGEQLEDCITELCDSAISMLKPYMGSPLDRYTTIIKCENDSKPFFPTLGDFVYAQAYNYCDRNRDTFRQAAIDAALPGTPSWAWWTCLDGLSSKNILALYDKYPDGITGGYLLYKALLYPDQSLARFNDKKNAPEAIEIINKYLASNPNSSLGKYLQSLLTRYTTPWVDYTFPAQATPAKPIKIALTHGFTPRITVEVYKINNVWAGTSSYTAVKAASSKIDCDKTVAWAADTISFDLPIGNYEVRVFADGIATNPHRYYGCNLTVTPWLPVLASQDDKKNRNILSLVDFTTGRPATGIRTAYVESRKSRFTPSGMTDSEGFTDFNIPDTDDYHRYYSRYTDEKGNSVYFGNLYTRGGHYVPGKSTVGAVFTDRPVYHPGDTVQWSFVAVDKDPEALTSRLASRRRFSVYILDANYQAFDTIEAVTDSMGRAYGATAMPTDRLTGRYMIQVSDGRNVFSAASVMVSDFKPPVFELDSIGVKRDGNTFRLTGRAMTYAGVAVDGAKIYVDIHNRPIYLRDYDIFTPVNQSYSSTTGPDGFFTIEIPADSIPAGMYECSIMATDAAANTASASATFRSGKPFAIFATIGSDASFNTDSIVAAPIYAYGNGDKRMALDAAWRLTDKSGRKFAGDCHISTSGTDFDWTDIPAGIYSLDIFTADSAMADTCTVDRICLYSLKKNSLPADVQLLLPTDTYKYTGDGPISITAGRGTDGYIYAAGFYPDGTPLKIAREIKTGFSSIDIPLCGGNVPEIRIYTVKDGNIESRDVNFVKYNPATTLTLKGESWRDNIVPGTRERWTLRLSDGKGSPVPGTMTATMYNHALDALASLSWPADAAHIFSAPGIYNNVSFNFAPAYPTSRSIRGSYDVKNLSIQAPCFLYKLSGPMKQYMLRRAANGVMADMVEIVEQEAPMAAEPMMYGALRKTAANSYAAMDAEAEVTEESADAGAGSAAMPGSESGDKFDYRKAEVLQAFWRPAVNIGKDGTATISFDVPDAIGAWSFRATAWTADCRAADMAAILTASKPVMVQANLPRFLRRDDKARVLATVYNNTDSTQVVKTVVEVFDPAMKPSYNLISKMDKNVLASATFNDTIPAHGQAIVPVVVQCTYDLSAMGYRVRSSANGFTDGEQSLIPVLDASTTAIDSEIFYLSGTDTEFTTEIPESSDEKGIVALQYCQNPVWDVVKTLPGLYDNKPVSSTAAAASAYAAFASRGLYNAFPEIRKALDLWQETPGNKALVSRLYDNEDIKLALLAQTPFVGSANANTEQMERLALTFDAKVIDRTAKTAISRLEALQNADGGFAWGDWYRTSSDWATACVLTTMGRLNMLGYYPAGNSRLDRIIDRAFGYIESQITDNDSALGYAYLYSLYPGRKPGNLKARKLVDKAVQDAVAGWKKYPTSQKVRVALMLHNLGNTAVASEIIRSVAQFAVPDGKQGTSFPSVNNVDSYASLLEAFATINPQSPLIDGMRQWLVLRTQVTSDLGAWDPLTLAAAFIATGSRWTSIPYTGTANVSVDGTPLEIDKVEALTGRYSLRLLPKKAARKVTFVRPADAPVSYGSVVSIAQRPLDKVKAASSRYLSIDKRYLVQRDGKWVETDRFDLGERVQVQLVIKADRDMEYITVRDDRPASFAPVDQMPGWVYSGNLGAYRENSDTHTGLYVNYLPKGTYYLTYEMTAALAGSFASGTATIQSQYAPEFTARSSAGRIQVSDSTTRR